MNSTVVCVNGRFSGFVTAPVLVQKQQISCRVRSQHDLKTFAKGSPDTFAARSTNGWSENGCHSLRRARTGKMRDLADIGVQACC